MSKPLKTSPSQIASWRGCNRLWLLRHFFYIPSIKKAYFAFGSILHKVVERWLAGDDNGRDANGNAVDLYPDGWATNVERDGTKETISEDEQILIKDLVQLAIEEGVIERRPGRELEQYFVRQVTDDVLLHGYMDVVLLDQLRVEDHKTSKSARYALSENKLYHDIKMRCYACVVAMQYHDLYQKTPPAVSMVLNYMIKDPLKPRAFRRGTDIAVTELEGEWERIEQDAQGMSALAKKYRKYLDFKDKPDYTTFDHEEVQGPLDTQVCNAYGGCPYQSICTGRESVQRYFKRVDGILNPETTSKENSMSSIFADKIAAMNARKGKEAAVKEPEVVEEIPADAKDVKADKPPAPWAEPKCTTCGGNGLDKHEAACAICFKLAKKAGLPLPDRCSFNVDTNEWVVEEPPKEVDEPPQEEPTMIMGCDGEVKTTATVKAPPKDNPLMAAKKAKAEAKAAEAAPPPPTPEPPLEETLPKKSEKKKDTKPENSRKGRPPMGYTLCLGALPVRTGTREVLYAEQLMEGMKAQITIECKEEFENMDVWARRDMLSVGMSSVLKELGAAWIVAPDPTYASQDMRAIIETMKTHADTIIVSARY